MPTLAQRLAKLEERSGPGVGRQIVVHAMGAFSEDEAAAFLETQGFHLGPRDRLVLFATIYEGEDDTDDDAPPSPRLLSVSAL